MPEPYETFETWYLRTHPSVVSSLTLVSGDAHLAADATDEAFARALERWDRVQGMGSPTGWVYTVGVNLLRRGHERRALERRTLRRVGQRDEAPPATLAVEVWDAVRTLPRREREAVALRYLGGLTEPQVAEALGLAPGTVARLLHDARRRLSALLGPDGRGEIQPNQEADRDRSR